MNTPGPITLGHSMQWVNGTVPGTHTCTCGAKERMYDVLDVPQHYEDVMEKQDAVLAYLRELADAVVAEADEWKSQCMLVELLNDIRRLVRVEGDET